jgi:hypothetical protein
VTTDETERLGATNGVTAAEARQVLARETRERVQQCERAIQAVLQQYECRLDAVTIIRNGATTNRVEIVALFTFLLKIAFQQHTGSKMRDFHPVGC